MRDTTRWMLVVLLFSTGCDEIGLYGPRCNGLGTEPPDTPQPGSDTDTSDAAPVVLVLGHDGHIDGYDFDGDEWYGLYDLDQEDYLCGWDMPAWGTRSQHYYACWDCAFTLDIYAGGEISVWADQEDDYGVSYCDIYGVADGDTAALTDTAGNVHYRPLGFIELYSYGSYVLTDVVVYYNDTYGWFPVGYGSYTGGDFSWYYIFWDNYYY